MTLCFAKEGTEVVPLILLEETDFNGWLVNQPTSIQNWCEVHDFKAELGQVLILPDLEGNMTLAVVGIGTAKAREKGRFALAKAASKLPKKTFEIISGLPDELAEVECLGWLLSQYTFSRYRQCQKECATLIAPDCLDRERLEAVANGEALIRDLINLPASEMSPVALEDVVRSIGKRFDADVQSTVGEDLLSNNFPMIHAVGRASDIPPRLIDLTWGTQGPAVVLVGKGVCFDTGGLNLKPGGSMGLMKKDMAGAATVLGLAQMIMGLEVKVCLRVLIPAVENSVSGNAFRPKDILTSRKGLTVEVNNTDAEGRLILADALALADDAKPDLIVSMATLTGAARAAVGTDLVPFYCDNDYDAEIIMRSGNRVSDPVWRMPFYEPYEEVLESGIADLDNAPAGGFAGSIVAALFLRRFVEHTTRFVHFDIYGWQPKQAPARPQGGIGQGARALLDAFPDLLDL